MFTKTRLRFAPSLSSICSAQIPSQQHKPDIILIWTTVFGIASMFGLLANSLMALFAAQAVAARSQMPQTNMFSSSSTARIQIAALILNISAALVSVLVLTMIVMFRREQIKLSNPNGWAVIPYTLTVTRQRLRWTVLWSGVVINSCSDIVTLTAMVTQERYIRPLHLNPSPAPLPAWISLIALSIIFQASFFTPCAMLLTGRPCSVTNPKCELADSLSYNQKIPVVLPPSPTPTVRSGQERALLGPRSDTTSARVGSFVSNVSTTADSVLQAPITSPTPIYSRNQSPDLSLRSDMETPPAPPQTPTFGAPPPPPTIMDLANIHPLFRTLTGSSTPSLPRCSPGTSILASPHHGKPLSVEKLTALRPALSNASLRNAGFYLTPPGMTCGSSSV